MVLTLGSFALALSLLPAIVKRQPPPALTCGLTGGILAAYVPTFLTLGLAVSAVAVGASALAWGVLLYQALRS